LASLPFKNDNTCELSSLRSFGSKVKTALGFSETEQTYISSLKPLTDDLQLIRTVQISI